MNIESVIRDFATADERLPEASMRWAIEHWEQTGPVFVDMLEACADGRDRSEPTVQALFLIIHLFGQVRDTDGFRPLCRLLQDPELGDLVLGDAVTETLPGILINTYDGEESALLEVVESAAADEFVRCAALDALSYLAKIRAIPEAEMRAHLLHLRASMQPQGESHVWVSWAAAAGNLGYRDFTSEVDKLIKRRFIPTRTLTMKDFREKLRLARGGPDAPDGFEDDRIGPLGDTVERLSKTFFAADEDVGAPEPLASLWSPEEPHVNPLRRVGRNDPCPCGSGRKYKKCCLPLSE